MIGVNLSTRDAAALLGAAGVKLGGGSWSRAFLFFVGSRIAMNYLNWPEEQNLTPGAQSVLQSVGGFCQQIFGTPPNGVQQQDQAAASGPTIDVDYSEVH